MSRPTVQQGFFGSPRAPSDESQESKMKTPARLTIAFVATALAGASAAMAQGTLYDDFSAGRLDPAKWVGFGGDPYWLDLSRLPSKGEMDFHGVGYAPTTNNTSAYGGAWGIAVTAPESVNGVSYSFSVKKIVTVACKNSTQPAATSTDFEGSFFNASDGSSIVGDVELSVAAVQHNTDGQNAPLSVIANAWECADKNCTRSDLFNQTIGTVSRGVSNTASIAWDKANHQFVFNLNGNQTIIGYAVSDASPAFFPYKGFDIQRYVPYCKANNRPYTSIDAALGPVYVNP
jgi:hypothetical protein